ncbi:NAD(P)H-hydrate dehydratase [Afifella marina]|uniref:Bifunctional NAD(P)H-hydrate repair enzyme n=2 Tax=Hyphomicrobiales TaxID=356 RepID=A0A1G5NKT9_AFIMA|nr:NAD(P)H-hydrate dehydratase [Afifella marina]MBK1623708.1 bifunctional ADP-dependent (S)-NAD(P)H-hydrate dehydratase/NAD(P)H-hydrate epimerase [Afifella marina DSM 2698]MBK1626701.1 bifunctional ADP-dependent (S)-NAD(P)H-hydrate dehydratase/NAD(P)H-hydrate epimerase [Afifella marina]MBK5916250.1 bifunctional ADP-dependent NAD(P)H-hydrate dehydratase/NAD(P)H-hydrate epimerase [Afifella marina]RAI21560.1 bifunctional ADP-dependent NAD(P)H-hydrate dehydratase/NAD(P)H-hydrate epimerase [Afifella
MRDHLSAEDALVLLTPEEMGRADRAAMEAGISGFLLMEKAGAAVADCAQAMCPRRGRVLVLAGPGNNGGDGFVAARLLSERGYRVRLALLGSRETLSGDAAIAASRWQGEIKQLTAGIDLSADLIVDALFGAGLGRPLEGNVAALVEAVNASERPLLAVDLPSGIDGRTGRVRGTAFKAAKTVTFFREKPGHLLLPGRLHCGEIQVADIGIPAAVLPDLSIRLWHNHPSLWHAVLPLPGVEGHKYARGHAVVVSGPAHATGAARLAARAALRAGAGLVSMAAEEDAIPTLSAHLTAIMIKKADGSDGLAELIADTRLNAVVIGPGAGVGEATCERVMACLNSEAAVVLDADAVTSFKEHPARLFDAIAARSAPVFTTPHAGEFSRLFPDLAEDENKVEKTRRAAERAGAVVILKGADTVVAAPDGRAAISAHDAPWLATAGTGDVLAGMIAGLAAQRMPAFEAACAAVWMHADAARRFGPGLISEDLPEMLPAVWSELAVKPCAD